MSGRRRAKCCGSWLVVMLCGCDVADIDSLDSELSAIAGSVSVVEEVDVAADELPVPEAYNRATGRSPFRLDRSIGAPEQESEYSTLQQYPLEVLTLQGTLARGDERWALVASPDGHLHRLGMAQYIGRVGWRITDIGVESMTLVASDAVDGHMSARRVLWLGGSGRK